jgi:hypothetical protein
MIAVLIIRPNKIEFLPALAINFILTNVVILISYIILNFFYELVIPPKKKKSETPSEEENMGLLKNEEVMVEGVKEK